MSNGLSHLEQKIYFLAKDAKYKIITYDIISSWGIAKENTLKFILHSLCKKGWFYHLKKGVYIVQPPFAKKIHIEDPFYTAQMLFNGYLAFSSALYIHHLIDEIPFTIFIGTKNQSKTKIIGEYEYKAVSLDKRAVGSIKIKDYFVSSIPKTIYDCFYLPEYAGSYSRVLKAVFDARMSDKQWKEFLIYVKKFSSGAFCQKVGYMLSLLDKKIPDFVFLYLKTKVKSIIYLQGKEKGEYNEEWKIIDNIGKENLLSWLYA